VGAPKVDITRAKGPIVLKLLSDKKTDNKTIYTHNDWHIEHGFLITYDITGTKRAYRIPQTITEIIEGYIQDDINGISGTALEG
jgi:hypothetical protein